MSKYLPGFYTARGLGSGECKPTGSLKFERENLAAVLCDECGRAGLPLARKSWLLLSAACGMRIDEQNDSTMEGLRAKAPVTSVIERRAGKT